jgi:hypothetical protein
VLGMSNYKLKKNPYACQAHQCLLHKTFLGYMPMETFKF